MKKLRAVLLALTLVLTGLGAAHTTAPSAAAAPVALTVPFRVVAIGDSYTSLDYVPFGAPVPWFSRLCAALGWSCTNLAHGGTGYLQDFNDPTVGWHGSFTSQIPAAVAAAPDAVFVLGGRNELGQENTATWQNGVAAFYTSLRQGLPNAAIYGLSPLWDDDPAPSGIGVMRSVVQAAVTAPNVGGRYLDLGNPFLGQPGLLVADGIHPNDAGMDLLMNLVMAFLTLPPRTRTPNPSIVPMPYPYPRPSSRP
jgi:lysophospholipase L1-like esterase